MFTDILIVVMISVVLVGSYAILEKVVTEKKNRQDKGSP